MLRLLFFTLVLTATAASSRRPSFDAKEIMRLIATVNPDTCHCGPPSDCEIQIPDVRILGIDCEKISGGPGSAFCCNSRPFIKPFVTPADLAALHAAAKRFKVKAATVQTLVSPEIVPSPTPERAGPKATAATTVASTSSTTIGLESSPSSPTSTENQGGSSIQETPTNAPEVFEDPTNQGRTASNARAKNAETTTTTASQETSTQESSSLLFGDCLCVDSGACETARMDFSFGKSCPYGKVRCCPEVPLTTTTTLPSTSSTMPTVSLTVIPSESVTYQRHSVPFRDFTLNKQLSNVYKQPRPVYRPTPVQVFNVLPRGFETPAQNRKIVVHEATGNVNNAKEIVKGTGLSEEGFDPDRGVEGGDAEAAKQTEHERHYEQYLKHIENQKRILEVQRLRHAQQQHNYMAHPQSRKPEHTLGRFQQFLTETGKALFKFLGK